MARPWEASFPRSKAFVFSVGLWWRASVGSRTSGGKQREERGGRCRHFVWLLWRLWRGDCVLSLMDRSLGSGVERDAAWRLGVRGEGAAGLLSLAPPPPSVPGLALSQCCIRALGARTRSSGPSPFSARFSPPPRPPRPPGVGVGFCRETLGGRLLVRCWPRPAPWVPREGAGPPSSRLRGLQARAETLSWPACPWDWENRGGMTNRFRDPGLNLPLANLVFRRQIKGVAFRGHTLSLSILPSAGAELGFPARSC